MIDLSNPAKNNKIKIILPNGVSYIGYIGSNYTITSGRDSGLDLELNIHIVNSLDHFYNYTLIEGDSDDYRVTIPSLANDIISKDEYKSLTKKEKEEDNMNGNEMFKGMFGNVAPGMCRISMDGNVAIKTSTGYKTYDVASGKATDCMGFALDPGMDMFFLIPTNKPAVGDIILVKGLPNCVRAINSDGTLSVYNYEKSTIDTVVPESIAFMGNTYFYGRIVSMFGDGSFLKGSTGKNKMLQFMMMSSLFKNSNKYGDFNGMNPMMLMLMMGNKGDNPFSGLMDAFTDRDKEDTDKEAK